jgi:uncharacterized membrane protein
MEGPSLSFIVSGISSHESIRSVFPTPSPMSCARPKQGSVGAMTGGHAVIQFSRDIYIDRPPNVVFTFISDLENAPQWQSEVTESKLLTPGPIHAGSKFRETVRILGKPVEVTCEITEYVEPSVMGYKSTGAKALEFVGQFRVKPSEQGAMLHSSSTTYLKGLWKLLEPFFAGEVRRANDRELEGIKKLLEAKS